MGHSPQYSGRAVTRPRAVGPVPVRLDPAGKVFRLTFSHP